MKQRIIAFLAVLSVSLPQSGWSYCIQNGPCGEPPADQQQPGTYYPMSQTGGGSNSSDGSTPVISGLTPTGPVSSDGGNALPGNFNIAISQQGNGTAELSPGTETNLTASNNNLSDAASSDQTPSSTPADSNLWQQAWNDVTGGIVGIPQAFAATVSSSDVALLKELGIAVNPQLDSAGNVVSGITGTVDAAVLAVYKDLAASGGAGSSDSNSNNTSLNSNVVISNTVTSGSGSSGVTSNSNTGTGATGTIIRSTHAVSKGRNTSFESAGSVSGGTSTTIRSTQVVSKGSTTSKTINANQLVNQTLPTSGAQQQGVATLVGPDGTKTNYPIVSNVNPNDGSSVGTLGIIIQPANGSAMGPVFMPLSGLSTKAGQPGTGYWILPKATTGTTPTTPTQPGTPISPGTPAQPVTNPASPTTGTSIPFQYTDSNGNSYKYTDASGNPLNGDFFILPNGTAVFYPAGGNYTPGNYTVAAGPGLDANGNPTVISGPTVIPIPSGLGGGRIVAVTNGSFQPGTTPPIGPTLAPLAPDPFGPTPASPGSPPTLGVGSSNSSDPNLSQMLD